jgi:hypothetical protein
MSLEIRLSPHELNGKIKKVRIWRPIRISLGWTKRSTFRSIRRRNKDMSLEVSKPDCFAVLERVFPLESNGLRSVRDDCRACEMLKDCLRVAAESPKGLEMRAQRMEAMDYGRRRGVMGFLSRWAELKSMRQAASKNNEKRSR